MMGSGKTTVGRRVAERLGWEFVDTDADILEATEASFDELFASIGEDGFRHMEARAIEAAVGGDRRIIAVGGGAVTFDPSRTLIADGATVVWLRARPDTLVTRVGDGAGRPLLAGDVKARVSQLVADRTPLYEKVADVVVDVDDIGIDDVVDRVAGELVDPA